MASLEIYKASAGSGKTFRIVREYLRIVFQRPGAYRNILAVTFTNKATAEMKDRILKDLAQLSSGKPSAHLEFLKNEFHKDEFAIRQTAHLIITLILHDYSRFSVSTIDSFFQRVIRAFSREMRLNSSYRTELDTKMILEEAVDRLFLELDNNPALKKWMLEYAEESLKNGKNWNFRADLISRGGELFKEEFKLFSEPLLKKLSDKSYLTSYYQQLKQLIDQYEVKLKSIGIKGLELIAAHGLTVEDFSYGKGSFANHFNKLANGNFDPPGSRTMDACNNLEAWSKAKDSKALKDKVSAVYSNGLNELLVNAIDVMRTDGVEVNTAKVILSNLFSFGLLTDIALKVREVSKEKNLVLLNDSTQLLRKVIDGADSPFVYEKMGSVYRNFMLDEFQDTSRMQWFNFKPLIENSLGEGNRNIIVGDVKQSIYRWRNGDWNLLATQVEEELSHMGTSMVSLDTNWRSTKNVIGFNNILFREAARRLNDDFENTLDSSTSLSDERSAMKGIIQKAYNDHFQKFSEKSGPEGYVKLQFIENDETLKKEEFRIRALENMMTQIETAQDNGVRPCDIAILVRGKKEGSMVAKSLLDRKNNFPDRPYCYDVISNDSLIIGQSPVVRFILNFFVLFAGSEHDIVKADLVFGYYHDLLPLIDNVKSEDSTLHFHEWLAVGHSISDPFRNWFKTEGNNEFDLSLLSLPLFDLASKIAHQFGLNKIKGEFVYLEAFLDLVLQYGRDQAGGIGGFLDWWELSGKERTITLSEGQNALTILTIHKSKGLEFHTVIVPFCDWEITPLPSKSPYLWCQPQSAPFNLMDLVLVRYGSKLPQTIFSDAYFKEMLYSSVDNLNLLYVALTRAVNSLIIYCPYTPKPGNSYKNIADLIQRAFENPPLLDTLDREKYIDLSNHYSPDTKTFELGSISKMSDHQNDHLSGNESLDQLFLSGRNDRLKLRLHSDRYLDLYAPDKSAKMIHGKLMHELFETIGTVNDVHSSILRMVSEGKMDTGMAEELEPLMLNILADEPFRSWFNGEWRVLNERDILRGNDKRHRPDRVMIKENKLVVVDYKTGIESEKHITQVKGYMKDFQTMGYVDLQGYLWYISENKLVVV